MVQLKKKESLNKTIAVKKKKAKKPKALASKAKADQMIDWIHSYASKRFNIRTMDERKTIPADVMLALGNQGMLGMQISEHYHGKNLSFTDTARVVEQLASLDMSLALFVGLSNANLIPLSRYASISIKNTYLPLLADGKGIAAFAYTEAAAGANVHGITTTAIRTEEGKWRIDGQKIWVGSAGVSTVINVFVKLKHHKADPGSITCFLLPTDLPGITIKAEHDTMGLKSMVQNVVEFDNVVVDSSYMLGKEGQGLEIAEECMQFSRAGLAAICLGGMKRALSLMSSYSQNRTVATGLLYDHPTTIHRLTAVRRNIVLLETLFNALTKRMDRKTAMPPIIAMANKVLASESIWQTIDDAMQVIGGRSYDEANMLPKMMRDARVFRIFEGPTETLLDYMGSYLLSNSKEICLWLEKEFSATGSAARLSAGVAIVAAHAVSPDQQLHIKQKLGRYFLYELLAAVMHPKAHKHPDIVTWISNQASQYEQEVEAAMHPEEYHPLQAAIEKSVMEIAQLLPHYGASTKTKESDIDQLLTKQTLHLHDEELSAKHALTDAIKHSKMRMWLTDWCQENIKLTLTDEMLEKPMVFYGVDSLSVIMLQESVKQDFDIDLTAELFYEYPTFSAFVEYLDNEYARKKSTVIALKKASLPKPIPPKQKFKTIPSAEYTPWLSTYLNGGYSDDIIALHTITLSEGRIEGLIDVTKYFMPTDGHYHIPIFYLRRIIIGVLGLYMEAKGLKPSAHDVPYTDRLEVNFIEPIVETKEIPFVIAVKHQQCEDGALNYAIEFSINHSAFIGSSIVRVPLKGQKRDTLPRGYHALEAATTILKPKLPKSISQIAKTDGFQFKQVKVSQDVLKAELSLSRKNKKNAFDNAISTNDLVVMAASQAAIVFACKDNGFDKKPGEFYAIHITQHVKHSKAPLSLKDSYDLEVFSKKRIAESDRVLYRIDYQIDGGILHGEVDFVLPLPKK